MSSDSVSYLVRITGKVQGVWYRAWTKQEATKRNLSGWVRNRRDGSVEALISGPEADVEDMLAAFLAGPPSAQVDTVRKEPASPPEGTEFDQKPTL